MALSYKIAIEDDNMNDREVWTDNMNDRNVCIGGLEDTERPRGVERINKM